MVKGAKTVDKSVLIEERPTKPPGTSKFSRKKEIEKPNNNTALFQNNVQHVSELCQQLLVNGYVQSYVDFYHLTHRLDPNVKEEKTATQLQISIEDMIFIRDNLVKAEVSRRQGDTVNVYSSFNQLAEFYVTKQDLKTGLFFYEKSLEVAQLTNDIRNEMVANHSLGLIHQMMLDFEGARTYHERHEQIAISIEIVDEIAKANVELYKVYFILAEKFESADNNNIPKALEMYFKCLESSKKSWDRGGEGEANGKIGNLLLNRGDVQESLNYLRQQSQIATDLGNPEARCRSCSALALALDQLGQADKALNELTLVHSISEQAGDIFLQAQACKSLGTLYSKVGKLEAAVEILQRHFVLLKSILYKSATATTTTQNKKNVVTSKDLDLARVYIGISKGNLMMNAYVVALQTDLTALLDWKLNRSDVPKLPVVVVVAATGSTTNGNNKNEGSSNTSLTSS
jgi:tetratricopeptide (TPR) repeat protein